MYDGTTPTLGFRLKNTTIDLSSMKQIWVTIADGRRIKHTWDINRVTVDNDRKLIYLDLTQAETFTLAAGLGNVQIRLLTSNDKALVTKKKKISIERVIKRGIIS